MSKPPEFADDLISSFGRRRGRRLLPYKQSLVDTLLPEIAIDPADCANLFPDKREIHLEVGFGAGERIAEFARLYPDIGIIGCEPYINGVAKLLVKIEEYQLTNVRLFTDDARRLLDALPAESIDKIFLLFPDPWPKPKHHKRRFLNVESLAMFARLQAKGSHLLLATDHVDYSRWMLEHVLACADYEWTAESKADWRTLPEDWVPTKYQLKTTAEGREPCFINCVRK